MKTNSFMNKVLVKVTFVTAALLVASCSINQNPNDSKIVAETHNEAKFKSTGQKKDAQFLVNASEINIEEIQLGKLAQKNGTSAHIKELGKMMEDAHAKSQNDLTALAKSKTIAIPTSLTDNAQNAYNKLNKKTGADFDKAYADLMVNGHKNAITMFEKASSDGNDVDIRNWATTTLPDLRTHLGHSKDCQKKCDQMSLKSEN